MTNTLTLDIETIPTTKPLSQGLLDALQQKIQREQEYSKTESPEQIKNKLMATNPYYGEIVVIGLQVNNEKPTALIGDEASILTQFWEILQDHRNSLFVHFNGLRFDVPYILIRSQYHRILPTNKNFTNRKRFSNYPHFDCYAVATDWYDPGKTINLKNLCEHLGIKGSKDGKVVASSVADFIKKGEINLVADYCKEDVRATFEAYNILQYYA